MPIFRALSLSLVAALSLGAASGCSSVAPTEPTATTEPASTTPSASESERVRAFLDTRYTAADVRYSFDTEVGQTVDCIDFFATRGARAMAARGTPLDKPLVAPPPQVRRRRDGSMQVDPPQRELMSKGVDANGHDRICPTGTVSQIRITPEEIESHGGLDAYEKARHKRPPPRAASVSQPPPPAGSMWPCIDGDFHDYAHVLGDVVDNVPGVGYGSTIMSVYAPTVPHPWEHSLAQVWMFGGHNAIDLSGSCTSDCIESVEVGWQVDSAVDDFPNTTTPDGINPYVFIFSTLDGYTAHECFNDVGSDCPTFLWSSNFPPDVIPGAQIAIHPPGLALASYPATLPVEMSALVIQIGNDYWVQIGINGDRYYIGCYPGTNFTQPMATFQVGGEVFDGENELLNTGLEMGTGASPAEGYGFAAYHHDFEAAAFTNNESVGYFGAQSMCASSPPGYPVSTPPYAYSTAPAPGASTWDEYFYYGGNPTCTPATCRADVTCGQISDGCGNELACGSCASGHVCEQGYCECAPRICAVGFEQDPGTCACIRNLNNCGGKGKPACQ